MFHRLRPFQHLFSGSNLSRSYHMYDELLKEKYVHGFEPHRRILSHLISWENERELISFGSQFTICMYTNTLDCLSNNMKNGFIVFGHQERSVAYIYFIIPFSVWISYCQTCSSNNVIFIWISLKKGRMNVPPKGLPGCPPKRSSWMPLKKGNMIVPQTCNFDGKL